MATKIIIPKECPMQNIINRNCNKWAVFVLFLLSEEKVLRFNELEKSIADISPKILSSTLKILEEDRLISRKVYPQVPPKVEYTITENGKIFYEKLQDFLLWANDEIFK